MLDLSYSLVIDKAKWGMKEYVELLEEQGLPVPPRAANPTVLIQNDRRVA